MAMINKLRTQQIIIDIPRVDSEPWILVKVQKIQIENSGLEHITDRWGSINKKLSDVAIDINDYYEPITVGNNQISVYGVSDAIKNIAISWIIEKYGGTVNQNGEIIL